MRHLFTLKMYEHNFQNLAIEREMSSFSCFLEKKLCHHKKNCIWHFSNKDYTFRRKYDKLDMDIFILSLRKQPWKL